MASVAHVTKVFRGFPQVFWALFAGQLVNRFGAMVVPFLVFYLGARGFSPGEISIVMTAWGAGGLAGQPLGGWLASRAGNRTTLLAGLLAAAVCLGCFGLASGIGWLLVSGAAVGLAGELYRPAASALLATSIGSGSRARAFGMMHWAFNVGAAVSGAVTGVLVAQGYWLLFVINSVTTVTFSLIVLVAIPPDGGNTIRRATRVSYRDVLTDSTVIHLLLLVLVHAIVYAQVRFGLPLSLAADGVSAAAFGWLIAFNAALVVLVQPWLVAWLSKFPSLPVIGVSWALVGVGLALSGPAGEIWQYLLTVIIWTAGEMGMAGFGAALIADLTPEGAHATYQAMFGWTGAISRLVGPALGGLLYEGVGLSALWWVCAFLGILGGLAVIPLNAAVSRRLRERWPDGSPC